LEITADNLADRWMLYHVEAVMLWPHDPEARARSLEVSTMRDSLDRMKGADFTMTAAEVAEVAERVWTLPTVQELQEEARGPTKHGLTAGMLLRWLISADQAGEAMTLEDGAQRVERAMREHRVGYKTVRNTAWPRYRDVAHLWAAHTSMQAQGATPFPCAMKDLPKFLAIAEAFRTEGEALRLPRSQKTALDPNRTWRVPGNLVLPRVTLGDPVQG
jgi:hypothetical protein